MSMLLDGDALAAAHRRAIAAEAAAAGLRPRLVTILVGDDPASRSYVGRKHGDCAELGFAADLVEVPAHVSRFDLLALIARHNADPGCHGLLVQFPLPPQLDAGEVQAAIDPAKDVDGLHPVSLGRMIARMPGLRPCTPQGILALLAHHRVPLAGAQVAVIGRGLLVGRPLAVMLADPAVNAVPTILHRAAPELAAVCAEADVIVSAAGQTDLVRADMVKPGAAVVGVGITYVDGAMVSDIAADVAGVAGWVTPQHGSVGAMTRAMLMRNLLAAARG